LFFYLKNYFYLIYSFKKIIIYKKLRKLQNMELRDRLKFRLNSSKTIIRLKFVLYVVERRKIVESVKTIIVL